MRTNWKNSNISVPNRADHEGGRAEERGSSGEAQKGNGIRVEERTDGNGEFFYFPKHTIGLSLNSKNNNYNNLCKNNDWQPILTAENLI